MKSGTKRSFYAERLEERLAMTAVGAPPVAPFASADGAAEPGAAFIGAPEPAPTSAEGRFYVGNYFDTNKTWENDSQLCWAASAANLLAYTNWGFSVAAPQTTNGRPLFRSGSEILSYFAQNFGNVGGYTLAGLDWFITGNYNYPSSYPRPIGGGGLYPGLPLSGSSLWSLIDAPGETMMARMAENLERGYGVSLGIGFYEGGIPNNRTGGHALTVWGYTYDTSFSPSDPRYYTGLILTDSDDGYTRTRTYSLLWYPQFNLYRLPDYGSGTAYVEYFVCLKPTRPLTGITISGYCGPYDGQSHAVTVEGIDDTGSDVYTVRYFQDGLVNDKPILYRYPGTHTVNVLVVRNGGEAVWSAPATITITQPPAKELETPKITALVTAGRNRHALSWNGVAGNSGYEVAWSADGGESWSSRQSDALSFRAANLPYGESVLYRVRALGDGISTSTSAWSSEKSLLVNPSDADGDGFIGPGDFALLSAAWFASDGSENWDPRFDVDG
ncbi:MAG: hypothetical protein IKE69_10355, partial [Thermoguttaceae bacterium]|nr:hypothetical protein [Thermoguttaceae bacterium]